jgi:formate/nitrite transporter FocA (FNT family)
MTSRKQQVAQKTEVEGRKSPSGKIVYASIFSEAVDELDRPSRALFWSGLAAGLSMGLSVLGVALLERCLPNEPWQALISRLGYSLGFLVVILGRQQLFTENTLTPVLPLMRNWDRRTLMNVLRLWSVVLVSNILGTILVALVFARTAALEPSLHATVLTYAHYSTAGSFGLLVLRGIFAGWLIALIVWLMPFAEVARIWVIIFLTYAVALANFPHVIAGAVEAFVLAWAAEISWAHAFFGFLLPTLIGNICGGVMLVAALNHAQMLFGAPIARAKQVTDTGLP